MDVYAYVREQGKLTPMSAEPFRHIPEVLCTWDMSKSATGQGNSFRGLPYQVFIKQTTGEDLKQEQIPERRVLKMSEALTALRNIPKAPASCSEYGLNPTEVNALIDWFEVVAKHRGVVVVWW